MSTLYLSVSWEKKEQTKSHFFPQDKHESNQPWKKVLKEKDGYHYKETRKEQHQPDGEGSSIQDSVHLTPTVHCYA